MRKRKQFPRVGRPSAAKSGDGSARVRHGHENERKPAAADAHSMRSSQAPAHRHHRMSTRKPNGGAIWLYGTHAVSAALENPARRIKRLLVTEGGLDAIQPALDRAAHRDGQAPAALAAEPVMRGEIDALFPADTVHQGVALLVQPRAPVALEDVLEALASAERALVVVLDQASDPRNVGAVLRSAAAFGASAVILPERHAPPESGALAKAASGALEAVPVVRVTNVARTLETLKTAGFWCVGLAPEGRHDVRAPSPPGPVALVLGAEGRGLRRLTLERCDEAARIPLAGPIASLNLSAAAAVALYAFRTCARDAAGDGEAR